MIQLEVVAVIPVNVSQILIVQLQLHVKMLDAQIHVMMMPAVAMLCVLLVHMLLIAHVHQTRKAIHSSNAKS